MKTKVYYVCKNENCSLYKSMSPINDPMICDQSYCKECYKPGELHITLGEQIFSSSESLQCYAKGLVNELSLLKRLQEAKIINESELAKYNEIIDILKDAQCPCCGNYLVLDNNFNDYEIK